MLLAAGALRHAESAPIMHLCNVNPHVLAALRDWLRAAGRSAAAPRQRSGAMKLFDNSSNGIPKNHHFVQPWPAREGPSCRSLTHGTFTDADCTVLFGTACRQAGLVLAGAPQQEVHGLAGTSSFGMSGVNAHMLLALPGSAHPWRSPACFGTWKRERYYPLPVAYHLAAGVSCPSRRTCMFCFRPASPATSFLAGSTICGQLVLPASALLEAAMAAIRMLGEQGLHAALLGITLPAQATLPEQPSRAAFTCSVSLSGAVSVEEAPDGGASRVVLGAAPAALVPRELGRGSAGMQKRSAVLQIAHDSDTAIVSEQAACTASIHMTAAHMDGFLCCPSLGVAALDMLSPALTSSQAPAPMVLAAADASSVDDPCAGAGPLWAAALGRRKAGQVPFCTGQVCSIALQLQAPAFRARRAKQDTGAAASQLVYDLEWQASCAWAAQTRPAAPAGKPQLSVISPLLCVLCSTTPPGCHAGVLLCTILTHAACCRDCHTAALDRCAADQPGRSCSGHGGSAGVRAAAAQGKEHQPHQPAEQRAAQHRIIPLAGRLTCQRRQPGSRTGRQQVPAIRAAFHRG